MDGNLFTGCFIWAHTGHKKQQLCSHPIHLVSSGRAERQCLMTKDPSTFMDIDDMSAGATNGAAVLSLEAETIAGAKPRYSCYRSGEKTFIQLKALEFFFAICFCVCFCEWRWGWGKSEILEFEALGAGYTFTQRPDPCTVSLNGIVCSAYLQSQNARSIHRCC